jgi:hypothetical protein
MATLNDAINSIKSLTNELEVKIPLIITGSNVTAKSLVQNRVQETGKDSKGTQLGDYSENKISPFYFIGKGSKATDSKLKKLQREKKKISYSDFRRLDGKQNKHVDLTFTGGMWRGIGLVQSNTSNNRTTVKIAPKDERTDKVSESNSKRYGNFLNLSSEEVEELEEDIQFEVESIINKYSNDF